MLRLDFGYQIVGSVPIGCWGCGLGGGNLGSVLVNNMWRSTNSGREDLVGPRKGKSEGPGGCIQKCTRRRVGGKENTEKQAYMT
jgi:hypothetical protein